MVQLDRHPLLMQCYDLSQLIEECGASEELTKAVVAAGELLESIDTHLNEGAPLGNQNEYLSLIQEKIETLYTDPSLNNYAEAIKATRTKVKP